MRFVPSLITMIGFTFGLAAIMLLSWPLAMASLACDAIDGHVARRYQVESKAGAMLDWSVDTALLHASIWLCFDKSAAIALTCAAVGWQAAHAELDILPCRTSGRAVLWAPFFFAVAIGYV